MLAFAASAAPCSAEIIFFTSGRTLSVKSHRVEGDSIVLMPRTGGEITCALSLVSRIAPDEIPYPEPELVPADVALEKVPFGELIERTATREGLDPKLVHAVIRVESAYRPGARSPKGAMGLMQLMPATARQYEVLDPYDPSRNVEAGVRHLKSLLNRFELPLALAAYNAGEAAVERFRGIPPYPETRNYVRRILQLIGSDD
jgi:soluble lytic murein transglycosylase-like protein